jgi:predicted ATP-grasp superfamily ATP-dependent carboligase
MKVFVTDGDQRPALAITRSLGRRGITVLVGEQQPVCLASRSRYCSGHVTYPSPYRDAEEFQRFVVELVQRESVDVVVPVTDVTTASICLNQDALRPRVGIAAPPFAAFDLVTNKSAALRAAQGCGIPIPRTLFVDGLGGLGPVIDRVEYPAVVKPARSRIPTGRGWLGTSVHYAFSETELRRLYERTPYLASYPSLIQQRIVGPGIGLFALFDHGELLAAFAHRRLREKPPSGGVSVLCESVPVEPRLRDEAVRLLGPLGWHGVAMLEYKRDLSNGEALLLEVNGRFWGSLELAVDAGVDFPYLCCQLAAGHRPEVPSTYRVGIRNRWLLGDLDHLLLRLFNRESDLCLPEGAPSRSRAVLDFFECTWAGLHDQVLSRDDPRPFRHELRRYAEDLAASVAGKALRHVTRARADGLAVARPSIPS